MAPLLLTRGLFSMAAAMVAVTCGYEAFAATDSAFLTGLIDTAYTLAFAGAAFWAGRRHQPLPPRASIAVGAILAAAVIGLAGVLTPLALYSLPLLVALVVGGFMGLNYATWYSLLRRGSEGEELLGQIGTYESFRVFAVLLGSVGGGVVAHAIGFESTLLVVAAALVGGGLAVLRLPVGTKVVPPEGRAEAGRESDIGPTDTARTVAPGAPDVHVRRRILLMYCLLGSVQFLLAPISSVTPVLAAESHRGSVAHVGVLFGLYGLGSVLQVVTTRIAARGVAAEPLVLLLLPGMIGAALLAAVWTADVSAGLLMLSFGFGVASIGTLINGKIQASVPESMRHKYVSNFAVIFALPWAAGSAAWGLAADFVPVPTIAVFATVLVGILLAIATGAHLFNRIDQ